MRRSASVLVLALAASAAHADGTVDKATAEALFMRAKALDKAGDFAAACPLYEGSFRADPQLGALLNLANCHEQVGRFATAWAEFREAVELANRRADYRSAYAQNRADALAPRVSWLAIHAPATTGLVVRRDEQDVTLIVGQELPIDPGTYAVTASAPGRAAWKTSIAITAPGTHAVVEIPVLEAEVAPAAAPAPVAPAPAPVAPAPSPLRSRATTNVAHTAPSSPQASRAPWVVGGVGIALAATGLVFGGRAFSQWNQSRDATLCDARNVCNAEGEALIASARQSATIGTYLVAGGGAVVATSVVWWAITRHRGSDRVEVTPEVSSGAVGLAVGGRF